MVVNASVQVVQRGVTYGGSQHNLLGSQFLKYQQFELSLTMIVIP